MSQEKAEADTERVPREAEGVDRQDTTSPEARQELIDTLQARSDALETEGRFEEAQRCLDELLARFGEVDEETVYWTITRVCFKRSDLLEDQERWPEALESWRQVSRRHEARGAGGDGREWMRAVERTGRLLGRQRDLEGARTCYEQVLHHPAGASAPWEWYIPETLMGLGEVAELQGRLEDARGYFEECIRRFGQELGPPRSRAVPRAQCRLGWLLCTLDELDKARACFKGVLLRYSSATDGWLQEQVFHAHRGLASILERENRMEEAMVSLLDAVRRHADSAETKVRVLAIQALLDLAKMRHGQSHREQARAHYEEVLRQCVPPLEAALDEQDLGDIHHRLAFLDWDEGRLESSRVHFEEAIRRFESLSTPREPDALSYALTNLGWMLTKGEHFEEGYRRLEGVVHRFGGDADPDILFQVTRALQLWGDALGERGCVEEAHAVYEELERRFDATSDVRLQFAVNKGRNSSAFLLMAEAKKCWQRGDTEAMGAYLTRAKAKLETSLLKEPGHEPIRSALAYLVFLQGHRDEARALALALVSDQGEEGRKSLLGAVQAPPLLLDEAWRRLVRGLAI